MIFRDGATDVELKMSDQRSVARFLCVTRSPAVYVIRNSNPENRLLASKLNNVPFCISDSNIFEPMHCRNI